MRYIGIITLLVLCLTLLFFTGCMINTVKPEPASGNLENQEDINQSSNNSQTLLTDPGTVYPQMYATGSGTEADPWANDCIKKAYDACPVGGTIYLRAGYYQLASALVIKKTINIIGEGMNNTFIVTANIVGLRIHDTEYVTIKNLTVDGTAQTDGTAGLYCIGVDNSDYITLENIETKEAGRSGVDIPDSNYSTFENIYAHDNWEHGVHSGQNAIGRNMYNIYRDIYAWDNGYYGFYDRGATNYGGLPIPIENCYNIFDNINCWDNEAIGIGISGQKGGVLSNSSLSGNGEIGIKLYHVDDFNVHDCLVTLNGEHGVTVQYANNVNLTNVIVKNNNVSDKVNCSGIYLGSSSGIKLTSCQSYDDRATPIQRYGIQLKGNNNLELTLSNCKLAPNLHGEIDNPYGIAITVITEKKKLSKF